MKLKEGMKIKCVNTPVGIYSDDMLILGKIYTATQVRGCCFNIDGYDGGFGATHRFNKDSKAYTFIEVTAVKLEGFNNYSKKQ